MGVVNREFWFLRISVYRRTYYRFGFLGFCGDMWRASWMYTSGLGRTTMSRYVNLSTSRLAAGAYIFYFIYSWNCILFLTGTVGMDYTSTTRSSMGLRLAVPHSRTNRFVHRVRGRVGTSRLSVWGWKCGQ
jgi:hypothetical protein